MLHCTELIDTFALYTYRYGEQRAMGRTQPGQPKLRLQSKFPQCRRSALLEFIASRRKLVIRTQVWQISDTLLSNRKPPPSPRGLFNDLCIPRPKQVPQKYPAQNFEQSRRLRQEICSLSSLRFFRDERCLQRENDREKLLSTTSLFVEAGWLKSETVERELKEISTSIYCTAASKFVHPMPAALLRSSISHVSELASPLSCAYDEMLSFQRLYFLWKNLSTRVLRLETWGVQIFG